MSDQPSIPIANTISIRDAGFDEFWLQKQICDNPSALKLGDLDVIDKEKKQSQGGRLDILLKDPEDDKMYEVEVMLGRTDETHIIRTIEYWDNERRKYPQRQHFAVLVAENIERRFFNVIHLFSHSIPIIAIQVNLIEIAGQKLLHFSQILNTYEEPDDSPNASYQHYDENYWRQFSPWTIENANTFVSVVKATFPVIEPHFVGSYIALRSDGDPLCWFHKRSEDNSLLTMWFSEKFLPEAKTLLDAAQLSYLEKNGNLRLTTNGKTIQKHADLFLKLTNLAKASLA
jgi:hypothetical protein